MKGNAFLLQKVVAKYSSWHLVMAKAALFMDVAFQHSPLASTCNIRNLADLNSEFLMRFQWTFFSESYVIIFKWHFAQMMPLLSSFDLNATLFVMKVWRGNHGNFLRLNEWTQQNSIKSQRSWDGKKCFGHFWHLRFNLFVRDFNA